LLVPDIDDYLRFSLITEVSAAGMKSPDCAICVSKRRLSPTVLRRLFGRVWLLRNDSPCRATAVHPSTGSARVARLDVPDQCDG